jgi:tetratricopeptide (TPR) repeat protein
MLQMGKAKLKMGRLELAESIFNQANNIESNIAEVYFFQGHLELKGFRLLAIKPFEKAVEINPFYPEALNNLAIEYRLAEMMKVRLACLIGPFRLPRILESFT